MTHPTRSPGDRSETPGPHGFHDAGALHPGRERGGDRVEPGAVVGVDEVDSGRFDPDEGVFGTGRGFGDGAEGHHLGSAVLLMRMARGMKILLVSLGSRWWNPGECRERGGARLTRRVREEPPPGELARVYSTETQRRAPQSGAVQPGCIAARTPPGFHHRLLEVAHPTIPQMTAGFPAGLENKIALLPQSAGSISFAPPREDALRRQGRFGAGQGAVAPPHSATRRPEGEPALPDRRCGGGGSPTPRARPCCSRTT